MEPEAYFERVVRFLETKGWNTSTSQLNGTTYVVSGTRESDTYYDRMLTMVATGESTPLTGDHMDFLRNAAEKNDVDQMMATSRGGRDDDARRMSEKYDISFIEPERIDDAFIDEFSVEDESLSNSSHIEVTATAGVRAQKTVSLVGFYLLFAVGFASIILSLDVLGVSPGSVGSVSIGSITLVSPVLPAVWVGATGCQTPATAFVGSAVGHLLFVGVVVGVSGLIDSSGLFAHTGALVVIAVPVAVLGAGAVVVGNRYEHGE